MDGFLQASDGFFGFDGDGFEAREADEAGCGAFGFGEEFSRRVVDDDFGVFTCLAEASGEFGGFVSNRAPKAIVGPDGKTVITTGGN